MAFGMIDRRRSQRITPPQGLWATIKAAERARIVDLSPHGAQVEVDIPLSPAKEFSVALPIGSGEFRVRALVHRCRTRQAKVGISYRAGLEFIKLGKEQVESIEDSIVDLCLTAIG